ncbi:hypothetical protein M758_10G071000 [Ceratodon purpureus]|nr:hypothetical protein M758_10G071000 [Ceratodon purpureus]
MQRVLEGPVNSRFDRVFSLHPATAPPSSSLALLLLQLSTTTVLSSSLSSAPPTPLPIRVSNPTNTTTQHHLHPLQRTRNHRPARSPPLSPTTTADRHPPRTTPALSRIHRPLSTRTGSPSRGTPSQRSSSSSSTSSTGTPGNQTANC